MKEGLWLSWADNEGLNGVCILQETCLTTALSEAIRLGIRPEKGGQLVGIPVDFDMFPTEATYRLLNKEEASKYV